MGTDITCWAERSTADGWQVCVSDEHGLDEDGNPYPLDFYCGQERNYEFYAILAGVRRLTNQGFDTIAPPRGLPDDSPRYQELAVDEVPWYHNASWLTLQELLDFPWHSTCREFNGFVDAAQYVEYRQHGRPQRFLEGGRVISNAEMEALIASGGDTEGLLTLISFGVPYAEFAGPFVTETLPLLRQQGEPDKVRIVFFFDS